MVVDHSTSRTMESMAISKFKATCLATLERVRVTGRPLRITRFGKPVAEIVPVSADPPKSDWLGSMKDTMEIRGDIVGPTGGLAKWDLLE